jgi:hypothetical protein
MIFARATIDTLRSFHSVASPFVLLREIELSIRELIKESINATELKLCIDKSLKKYYEEKGNIVPKSLKEQSFNDLVMILRARLGLFCVLPPQKRLE